MGRLRKTYEEWKKAYGDKMKLRVTVYAPDLETKKTWEEAAEREGVSLSRWIIRRIQSQGQGTQPSRPHAEQASEEPKKREGPSRRDLIKYGVAAAITGSLGYIGFRFGIEPLLNDRRVLRVAIPYDSFPGKLFADFVAWMQSEGNREFEGVRWTSQIYVDERDVDAALASGQRLDVIVVENAHAEALRRQGLLQDLDPDSLPNRAHIAPEFRDNFLDTDADGSLYAVPLWLGVTGLVFLLEAVDIAALEALGWDVLWNRSVPTADGRTIDVTGRIEAALTLRQRRGIALKKLGWDAQLAEGLTPTALPLNPAPPYYGRYQWSVNDTDPAKAATVDAAADYLAGLHVGANTDLVRPSLLGLRAGSIGQGLGHPLLNDLIPKQGSGRYAYVAAIPQTSGNPDAALRFLDFLARPEHAATLAAWNLEGSPNAGAWPLLAARGPDPGADPRVHPDPETAARLEWYRDTRS